MFVLNICMMVKITAKYYLFVILPINFDSVKKKNIDTNICLKIQRTYT